MLRPICAILGLLAGITAVQAADMPVKAAPKRVNPFISYTNSGFYFFGGGFGGATNVEVGTTGRLSASGGGVSAGVGWMKGFTTTWAAVDVRANYSSIGAEGTCAAGVACSFAQRTTVEVRAKYGADSTKLAQWLPSFGLSGLFDVLPVVPDGVQTPSHPYIFGYGEVGRNKTDVALLNAKAWRNEIGAGVGMVHQMGARTAIDTWAKCGVDPGSSFGIGTTTTKLGTSCKGGLDLIF